jgi:CHAT domain-containing protein/tetratricopeptide (TPR) repeat protein
MGWLTNSEKRRFDAELRKLATESEYFYVREMYPQAIHSSLRASELIAARFGTENPDYALSVQALADIYVRNGDHAKATALNREALDIFRRTLPPTDDRIGYVLSQLTRNYETLGNVPDGADVLEQLKEWLIATRGYDDPTTLRTMTQAAFAQLYLGRVGPALAGLNQLLDITRALTGVTSGDSAIALHHLAFAHLLIGDYSKARELLNASTETAEQAFEPRLSASEYADIHCTVGLLCEHLDDYAGAKQAYRRALSILGDVTAETRKQGATLLNNLAGVYRNTHQAQASESTYLKALELLDAGGALPTSEQKWSKAQIQTNLSQLYRWMGRYGEAENLSRQAMVLTAETTGDQSPEYANRLHNLGLILENVGKTDETEHVLRQALALQEAREGELSTGYAATLSVLATLFVRTHRHAEAAALMKKQAGIDDHRMWAVLSASSERQRLAHLDRLRKNTFGHLSFALRYPDASPSLVEDVFNVILRRKAASLDLVAAERLASLSTDNVQWRSDIDALRSIQEQLAAAELGPRRVDQGAMIEQWTQQREQLEAKLAQRVPELELDVRLRNATSKLLMESLPAGSAVVEYVRFEPFDFMTLPDREGSRWRSARYVAFVLRSGSSKITLTDLGEAAAIDDQIVRWRNQIIGRAWTSSRDIAVGSPPVDVRGELQLLNRDLNEEDLDPQPAHNEGTALRKAIFDPLTSALGNCQRLFVAPDGELSGVAFEALPSDAGRFLIDDYTISYVTVARDVLRFGVGRSAAGTTPVVAADPAFDLAPADGKESQRPFSRLSGARAEGREIAALLGVEPLLDVMVLEGPLKKNRSPTILHLATHGFVFSNVTAGRTRDDDAPQIMRLAGDNKLTYVKQAADPLLRSGLALAGANTWVRGSPLPEAAEDGLLMAADVFHMHLSGTELVTLSACETGLGEAHVGESIFGLRRAFVVAGAKTLIMSLWKVPDSETRALMTDMYAQLVQQTPRAEALRVAQLALKQKYPTQPYYWGAFICQGDPRPLDWRPSTVSGT